MALSPRTGSNATLTTDDYHNSKAVRLAREADPTGDRTIGVLTKADTVHGSENEQWVKAVQGHQTDKSKLKLGYYVRRFWTGQAHALR